MRTIKVPLRHTTGYGLGGIFSRIGQMVTPLFKSAARAVQPLAKNTLKQLGKQGLQAVGTTISDVVQNNIPVRKAIKKNAKAGVAKAKNTLKRSARQALLGESKNKAKRIKGEQTGQGFPFFSRKRKSRPLRKKPRKSKGKKRRYPYRGIFD